MSCDVGEVTERLEKSSAHSPSLPSLHLCHKLCSFSKPSIISPTSQALLILQAFHHFTYVTSSAHSPSLPSFYLCHKLCSFSNPSITSHMSQALLILQPFRRFTYVTAHSPTLPLLDLRDRSFPNPSFDSPTSQALHLIHLAYRP